jgi:Tfp pilus assembly protein PilN
MIKINLAKRKQSSSLLPKGTSLTMAKVDFKKLNSVKIDAASLKGVFGALLAGPRVVMLVLGVVGWFAVTAYEAEQIRAVEAQIAEAENDKVALQAKVSKQKDLETIKKTLESDEQIIKTKINAVKLLLADRGGATRLLFALTSSMPKEVWISDFSIKDGKIFIKGNSFKFEVISDFMKSLGEHDIFKDLNLKNTRVVKDDSGAEFPEFELELKRKQ